MCEERNIAARVLIFNSSRYKEVAVCCSKRSCNVDITIINLPFWDGVHHLFMVVFGGGLLLLYPHDTLFVALSESLWSRVGSSFRASKPSGSARGHSKYVFCSLFFG